MTGRSASRGPMQVAEGWKRGLDFCPAWFKERRQLKFLAQRGDGLVDRKAWRIGRDLEQHATRLPEIHGSEILPVQLRRVLQAMILHKLARHRSLYRVIHRAKSNMMDRTAAHLSRKKFLGLADVDEPSSSLRRTKAQVRPLPGELLEAQGIVENRGGADRVPDHQGDAVEAPDGVLGGNIAVRPGFLALSLGHTDQRKTQPIGVLERQDGLIKPLFRSIVSDALCKQARVQNPMELIGTRNAVCCARPIPVRPGAASSHGKKVKIVPGCPT